MGIDPCLCVADMLRGVADLDGGEMKDVFIMTPTGLVRLEYEPRKWYHLNLFDVVLLVGMGAIIGIICYGLYINFHHPCPKCQCVIIQK